MSLWVKKGPCQAVQADCRTFGGVCLHEEDGSGFRLTFQEEGVESADSEQMLQALSCDFGQGYYYSKPIPVLEFQQRYLEPSHPA